jgi:hypothetical protein
MSNIKAAGVYLKSLNEISLPLVRRMSLGLTAQQIVSVQPMTTTLPKNYFYLDFKRIKFKKKKLNKIEQLMQKIGYDI